MRILMLSPDAQMIDRRIVQEARTLHEAGHAVTLLSGFECALPDAYMQRSIRIKRFSYDWKDRRRADLATRLGPRLASCVWPGLRLLNRALDGPTAFEAFVLGKIAEHDFDVMHVHDLPLLKVGSMAARRAGAKLVYDAHEFYPMQSVLSEEQRKRYLRLERKLMRDCAVTITVNPYLAEMMGRTHSLAPPRVILNAIATPPAEVMAERLKMRNDPALRAEARKAKGLPERDFLFLYQGWVSAERNIEVLIEAMATQPKGRTLVLVGYGDHLEVLRALADRLAVADRCLFYGRVESDELQSLTALCDVGVIPYTAVDEMHRYCSPNKLYEFIMAGLPILASDLPYLRDVIEGYGLGWLGDLGTPASTSELMSKAALGDDLTGNLEAARGKLNWEIEGAKLVDIYASI
jgi:glycosyltransferase involved in cell wall biosynthesis